MTKLNYVIKDYDSRSHKINRKDYRTFDELLDIIYVRGNDLSDLLDANARLHQDVNILVDDPYATKDELEKEVLDILKKIDEYTTKRYAETYYSDYAELDCEVGDAFECEDTIDEFVLDDEVVYKEKTTQYIDIYYYANIEEVSKDDVDFLNITR